MYRVMKKDDWYEVVEVLCESDTPIGYARVVLEGEDIDEIRGELLKMTVAFNKPILEVA